MAKYLITIVSKETVPNALFIKNFDNIDEYIFFETKEMKNQTRCIQDVAKLNAANCICNEFEIEPYSYHEAFKNIEAALKDKDFNNDDDVIINLTGGTKMMALAVYNYFVNGIACKYKLKLEIYYIPIDKNEYLEIYPNAKDVGTPFKHALRVREYLAVHGLNILSKKYKTGKHTPNVTARVADYYLKNSLDKEVAMLIERKNEKPAPKKLALSDLDASISVWLENIKYPFLHESNLLKQDDIEYLTGGWFEEWVKNQFDTSSITDIEMSINVRQDAENELDILVTKNNQLHVIECKSKVDGKLAEETIYKSKALAAKFGLKAKTYVFFHTIALSKMANLNTIINRAKDSGVELLFEKLVLGELTDSDAKMDSSIYNFNNFLNTL